MYPDADIPLIQLSVDATQPPAVHFEFGRKLAALRDKSIMIVASGNVVHNLRMARWQGNAEPYAWALSFNDYVRENLSWEGPVNQHPLVNFMQH